jgi:DNA-binding winged helix-turn-helix (wHTH) protein
MGTDTQGDRPSSLVVELANGTVVVDDQRIELPRKEFTLLAELAARPGEATPSDELIPRVWPETPGMAPQDIYWHVWELRKRLGDDQRDDERKLLANRRGFGYFINLPPHAVRIEQGPTVSNFPVEEIDLTEHTEEETDEGERPVPLLEPADSGGAEATLSSSVRRPWALLRVLATTSLVLLVAAAVGFALSRWIGARATQPQAQQTIGVPPDESRSEAPGEPQSQREGDRSPQRARRSKGQAKAPTRSSSGGAGTASSPAPDSAGTTSSGGTGSTRGDKRATRLPPAPTRFLFHLYNPDSGDHFVTVDANVASQYEGKGYLGAAIGRVYVAAEKGTKAITTNHGTAYIFIESGPKTEPASQTLALWYASNGIGDFFYTTDKSEGSKDGFSTSLIGYVRKPT